MLYSEDSVAGKQIGSEVRVPFQPDFFSDIVPVGFNRSCGEAEKFGNFF